MKNIKKAIKILARAYNQPVTAMKFVNIISETGVDQDVIYKILDDMVQENILKKERISAQYYYSLSEIQTEPHYYYAFQSESFDEQSKGEYLFVLEEGEKIRHKHHHKRLKRIKKGDVILHECDKYLVAVSVASTEYHEALYPEDNHKKGWLVNSDYLIFPHPIKRIDYCDEISDMQPGKGESGPFNKNGGGNQGYIFESNQKLTRYLLDMTGGFIVEKIDYDHEEDQSLIEDLRQASLSNGKDLFIHEGEPKEKAEPIEINGHKVYLRNRKTSENALAYAHYLCEVNENHLTFIRKNSDKNYTEPHHLVPMSASDKFQFSLDVEENIVSLCSNCHNQIHYGRDAKDLLKILYNNRKMALKSVGIDISFEQLLDLYDIK